MADTYTDELRIRLQEDGANSTTWGSLTNTNLQLIEDAVSGMVEIATTGGTTTLTTVSGGTDQARMAILKVTGVLVSNATIEVPAKTKKYLVWNATSGAYTVTVKTNAGTGILVTQGLVQELFCDATNVYPSGVATPIDSITSGVTGTGSMVRATSPTLVTPALGTPSALVGTNITGTAAGFTAGVASAVAVGGITGLGTGVATALAVAVGSAGAPVVLNGAGGTPSSMTGTNITGIPAAGVSGTALVAAAIGTTVQAYDADTAKLDVVQKFTVAQRGTQTTDNDGSFDLDATNNFKCTTAGALALTFTNIDSDSAGQSGNILFINASNHAITAAATTKVASGTLAAISVTGTYLLGYYCDGTNVYVAATGAMS